jgi:hypothetical protein
MTTTLGNGKLPESYEQRNDGSLSFTIDNLRVEVYPCLFDYDSNPRDWDNLGTMICRHPRYTLGDEGPLRDEIVRAIDETLEENEGSWAAVFRMLGEHYGTTLALPLYLYDHSGLSMKAGAPINLTEPSAGSDWDTTLCGLIIDTEQGRQESGTLPENIAGALRHEVEIYSTYLEGDIWAWSIFDRNGIMLDSCGSILGLDNAIEYAVDQAPHLAGPYQDYGVELRLHAPLYDYQGDTTAAGETMLELVRSALIAGGKDFLAPYVKLERAYPSENIDEVIA